MRGLRVAVIALLAVAVLGTGRGNAAGSDIRDVCGDADTYVEVDGDRQVVEGSLDHVDIAGGRLSGTYDNATLTGISAALDLCGAASSTDGGYSVHLRFDDGCVQHLTWTLRRGDVASGDLGAAASGPRAVLEEYCYRYTGNPTGEAEEIFRTELPSDAVSFEGPTVTFTVALEAVPEEGKPRYAPGTRWHLSAVALDQTASGSVFAFGDGPDAEARLRADTASAHQAYVVGQDAG